MKEQIINWLIKSGYYENFIINFNSIIHRRNSTIDSYIEKTDCQNIITNAFIWHNTKEGNQFWYKVNLEYLRWLNKV